MTTVPLEDFLRSPMRAVEQASLGAVRIARQGGEDLFLMHVSDLERQHEGIGLAARLLRAMLASKGDLAVALNTTFAWVPLLDAGEREEFVREATGALRSAVDSGHYADLVGAVRSWRGTAEAYADGYTPDIDDGLAWTGIQDCPDSPSRRGGRR